MLVVAARPKVKRAPAPTPPRECRALGRRIRQLRDEQGISQEKLAEKADIHRTYLGGIEVGIRNPSLKNIAAIASATSGTRRKVIIMKLHPYIDGRRQTESTCPCHRHGTDRRSGASP